MKSKKRNMVIGFEIESVLNREIHNNLTLGYYHNGKKFNKYFTVEGDSSLYNDENFNIPLCCEFVSKPLKSKKSFLKAIDLFIKDISKNHFYPLKEVINFNYSCGCHIHIGITKGQKYHNLIDFEILKEMRELFFKKIDNSKIGKKAKLYIKSHYFRSFANETKKRHYDQQTQNRSVEFNVRSEEQGKGLEWRAFNLYGVENWKDFKEVLLIGYECANFLFKKRINGYTLKKKTLRLPKKEMLNFIDEAKKEKKVFINYPIKEEEVFIKCAI